MATTPFAHRENAYCTRCRAHTRVEVPWRGWPWLRRGWFVGLGLIVLGSPVIGADGFVLLPMAMVFASGLGPLSHLASLQPTCLTCGARVEHKLRVTTATEPAAP